MNELAALQAVRLKGRADAAVVARSCGLTESAAQALLDQFLAGGLVKGGPTVRITAEGRDHLATLTAAERDGIDQAGLTALYEEFDHHNEALKAVVTSWQLKDLDTPNDHTDAAYDAAVIAKLIDSVDTDFRPLLDRLVATAPRLCGYRDRFDAAVAALRAGDHSYVAKPILDSYHTVWFELHEELIGMLGRTRLDEAAAGRAV